MCIMVIFNGIRDIHFELTERYLIFKSISCLTDVISLKQPLLRLPEQ
jgi:hypothetical protein